MTENSTDSVPDRGSALDAKRVLIEKARRWRSLSQFKFGDAEHVRAQDAAELEARLELADAAVAWLWHEENPSMPTIV